MDYEGHLTGGVVTGISTSIGTYVLTKDLITSATSFGVVLITSLYPDMDIGSIARRQLTTMGILLLVVLVMFTDNYTTPVVILSGLLILPNIFKHRGFVHTLLFGAGVSYALYYLLQGWVDVDLMYTMIAGMLGYSTHLILDSHFKLL